MPKSVGFVSIKHQNNIAVGFSFTAFNILSVSVLILCCLIPSPFFLKYFTVADFLLFYMAHTLIRLSAVSIALSKTNNMPTPFKQPVRLVIFITDVMKIYDCSSATASRKIAAAKLHNNKKLWQLVSIKEFCEYFSLDYTETCTFLNLM